MDLLEKFLTLGIPENICEGDVEWLRKIDESQDILGFLTKCVDPGNVLSYSELNAYNLIHDSPVTQNDSSLELNELVVYSNVDDLRLDHIAIEEDYAEIYKHEKVLQQVHQMLCNEIEDSKGQNDKYSTELKNIQKDLFAECQSMMKLSAVNRSHLQVFSSCSSKLQAVMEEKCDEDSAKCLVSQMDLTGFSYQCSKVDGQLRLYMKRVFKKMEKPEISKEPHLTWLDEFKDIPQKMWEAGVEKMSSQAQYSGIISAEKHITQLLKDSVHLCMNDVQLRMEADILEEEVSNLSEDLDHIRKGKVSDIVEDEVLSEITSVSLKVAQQRIDRRLELFQKLCTFRKWLDERVFVGELVWMLLHREAKMISCASQLLTESYDYFEEELSEHLSVMDELEHINKQYKLWSTQSESQPQILSNLHTLLESQNDMTPCISIADLYGMEESLSQELESKIFDDISLYLKQQEEGEHSLNELTKILNGCCTKKPLLYPDDLFCQLEKAQTTLSSASQELAVLQKTFSMERLALESTALHNQRLLWAWFLVAPKRLEEALQLIN